ncbi:Transposase [compost metagenome]
MRQAWERVYVGIDHHSRQITVAAASGAQFQESQGAKSSTWMQVTTFTQDGLGYAELLDWLGESFSGVPRERFVFVSEPTFSKPLCHFLASAGFASEQILWVKTIETSLYRKAKGVGNAGKNDQDDARVLATMAFEAAAAPHERRRLFQAVPHAPVAEGLRHLADDHARVSKQLVAVKNQITDLVMRLFPECRRVWGRMERGKKPDGTVYEQRHLSLFNGILPMRILSEYPLPREIAKAGFERLWERFGGTGFHKKNILKLLELAQASGGVDNPLDARRLKLLITEYQHLEAQLEGYRAAMRETFEADPILASLGNIHFLSPQGLAAIVGEMGDVRRFDDADALKRYLNVAPTALPQTGDVDANGVPVQRWRLPTNSYKRTGGVRKLVYESRGIKSVRHAAYLWFDILVMRAKATPDDPFAQLYLRLKEKHQGKAHWLGKVRWKVIAKLITTIYHCLRKEVLYDPVKVLPFKEPPRISGIPPAVA